MIFFILGELFCIFSFERVLPLTLRVQLSYLSSRGLKMFPANYIDTGSQPRYQTNDQKPETDNDSDKVATQPEVKKADSHATRDHDSKTIDQRNVCHAESSLPSKSNVFHEDASGISQDEKAYISKLLKNAKAYKATFHAKIDFSSPEHIDLLQKMEVTETEIALTGITKGSNTPIRIVLASKDKSGYFTSQKGEEFILT